jgi:hypothetical protein
MPDENEIIPADRDGTVAVCLFDDACRSNLHQYSANFNPTHGYAITSTHSNGHPG